MKAVVEDLGGSQKKLVFEIPPEQVAEEMEKYCRKLAKEVDIKGFRKGKAPSGVIKRFFRDQVRGEVVSKIVSSSLEKVLEENALIPVGEPEIDAPPLEEGKSFPFTVTLDVKPHFEVKGYQGLRIEQEPLEVKDEEIQTALEELRKTHAELKGVEEDRAAERGDVVLVDYEGFFEDRPVPGTERKDAYIELGAGGFKSDVEEALLGSRVGEMREVEVEYPANLLNKEIAGKRVQYRFYVKKISEKRLPDLDDEFAKDVGAYENLEALRARLTEEVRREKEVRARKRREENLLDAILEKNPFEAPRSLVKSRKEQMVRDAKAHFLSQGLALENESEGFQRLEAEFDQLAEKEVCKRLILEAIAEKEKITISDADLEQELERIAEKHNQSVEKVKGDLQQQEEGLKRFRQNLRLMKTLDFLMSADTIE